MSTLSEGGLIFDGSLPVEWSPVTLDSIGDPIVVTGYKVHHGPSSGVYDTVVDVGNVTSYSIAGLDPDVLRYVAVSAYDATRDGGLSNELGLIPKLRTQHLKGAGFGKQP